MNVHLVPADSLLAVIVSQQKNCEIYKVLQHLNFKVKVAFEVALEIKYVLLNVPTVQMTAYVM